MLPKTVFLLLCVLLMFQVNGAPLQIADLRAEDPSDENAVEDGGKTGDSKNPQEEAGNRVDYIQPKFAPLLGIGDVGSQPTEKIPQPMNFEEGSKTEESFGEKFSPLGPMLSGDKTWFGLPRLMYDSDSKRIVAVDRPRPSTTLASTTPSQAPIEHVGKEILGYDERTHRKLEAMRG